MRPEIHSSDRVSFKRCRRRWWLSSHLGLSYESLDAQPGPLWYGTGMHFAMEDFHGHNTYGHPFNSFEAYISANLSEELPEDVDAYRDLAKATLNYYVDHWLPRRNILTTTSINGIPQVEVAFKLRMGRVDFAGTFDRIARDNQGQLWVVDYKNVKTIDRTKLELDQQISSYAWAASKLYKKEFAGVAYMQFVKKAPGYPDRLKGGGFSKNKAQATTYGIYHQALIEAFGYIPTEYEDFLTYLSESEGPDGDAYIRIDFVYRNPTSRAQEALMIRDESREMLRKNLSLYPNPTRDCVWDCQFRTVCLAMNDGSDFQGILDGGFKKREKNYWETQSWRYRLPAPAVHP